VISLGVDPGVNGAIACYSTVHGLLERSKLPTRSDRVGRDKAKVQRKVDGKALAELVANWSRRHDFAGEHVVVVIERISSFGPASKTPPTVLLSMGYSAGLVEGVLCRYGRETFQPRPQTWKPAFGLTADKQDSVLEVQRRFGITVGHDQAEAILLAVWGSGQVNGPTKAEERDPFASVPIQPKAKEAEAAWTT
jgi:hypothetical protein